MLFPAEHSLPSACNQRCCSGGHTRLCYPVCSSGLTAPRARRSSGIKNHVMQEEIKSKPIILNGFTCISREQEEGDKTLVKRGNGIFFFYQLPEVISCFSMLLIRYLSHYLSECILVILIKPRSLSVVCVSSCLRLARNDGLPRIRHGAGIYQATELSHLDKSDMCEHASVSLWFSCLFLHL